MSLPGLDRPEPAAAIAAAAKGTSNWVRWGVKDVRGTVNLPDAGKRPKGVGLVCRGLTFTLAQRFGGDGPQKGWRRRAQPRAVVDPSNQLAQWQLDHVQGDIPSLMRTVTILTSQPA